MKKYIITEGTLDILQACNPNLKWDETFATIDSEFIDSMGDFSAKLEEFKDQSSIGWVPVDSSSSSSLTIDFGDRKETFTHNDGDVVKYNYKPSKSNLLERETIAQERIADSLEKIDLGNNTSYDPQMALDAYFKTGSVIGKDDRLNSVCDLVDDACEKNGTSIVGFTTYEGKGRGFVYNITREYVDIGQKDDSKMLIRG